jgi:hypothetical protein
MHIAPIFPYSESHEANYIIKLRKPAQKILFFHIIIAFFFLLKLSFFYTKGFNRAGGDGRAFLLVIYRKKLATT